MQNERPKLSHVWLVFICALLFHWADVRAQAIATDRPDFADATSTVPVGVLQVESGYSFSRDVAEKTHTLGEWMVRTGLGGRSDIRFGVDSYIHDGGSGFGDGSLDFRFRLREAREDLGPGSFNLSLLAGTSLPTGSRDFRARHFQPAVMLTSDLQLSPTVSIAPAINYVLVSGDTGQYSEFTAGGSLVFKLGPRTTWYLESFGAFPEGGFGPRTASAGSGVLWLLRDNVQFDIHGLGALNGPAPSYQLGLGFSVYAGLK